MSLTMMALRIAAVEALKAADTLVGDNVLDSQISAIDQTSDGALRSDLERPFIAVYSDTAKSQDLDRTGLRTNGRVELLFNSGVSLTMAQTDKETGASEIVEGFPATDAHFEAVLDVIDVQISRALIDPDNPWAQVFSDFVHSFVAKDHIRSSSAIDKVRIAAGQTKLTVDVFADPRLGQPLVEGGPWPRFLALMDQHSMSQLSLFATLLGEEVVGPYAEFERLTGMSTSDAEAMRLYSFGGVEKTVTINEANSVAELG